MLWAGEMGDVVSLLQVMVGVSWYFAWMLLGRGSSLELDWGQGMVSDCVPG